MEQQIKVGLISDTHGWLHPELYEHFDRCDEIWHAGDIGGIEVLDELRRFKPLRAVYGNIDDASLRRELPGLLSFTAAGLKVLMTHIGGYPGRYAPGIKNQIHSIRPGLFVCGHSHIAKVMPDRNLDLLHINPGAAGYHGFHQVMTAVRFTIDTGKVVSLELIEMGERGGLSRGIRTH